MIKTLISNLNRNACIFGPGRLAQVIYTKSILSGTPILVVSPFQMQVIRGITPHTGMEI
jgi:hypothetical protein